MVRGGNKYQPMQRAIMVVYFLETQSYAETAFRCLQMPAIFGGRMPQERAIRSAYCQLMDGNADFTKDRPRPGRPCSVRTEGTIAEVHSILTEYNGMISAAALVRRLEPNADGTPAMSKSTALKIMRHDIGTRAFKLIKTQELRPDDLAER